MSYSLLVKGGTVIDPSQGLNGVRDVAFSDGKVALVAENISDSQALEVFDATGCVVTPGVIDLHVHVFWGTSDWSIAPDPSCVAQGVTTAVDAGSAGALTFPAFRKYVLEQSVTRVYALLNICAGGALSPRFAGKFASLEDPRWADVDSAVDVAQNNSEYIIGIKAILGRSHVGKSDKEVLKRAIEAASAVGKFVMVHVGNTNSPLEELAAMLRPGDVITHCFHNLPHGFLDDAGRVFDGLRDAQKRGVCFDVGHGVASFSFEIIQKALAQGFVPDNLSSDLHFFSIEGPVPDQLNVLNKFMYLGLKLEEVIRLTTESAARIMGLSDKLGTLKVGAEGDATIMRLEQGRFPLTDSVGVTVEARQRLAHVRTVRLGRLYRPYWPTLQTPVPTTKIMWRELLGKE